MENNSDWKEVREVCRDAMHAAYQCSGCFLKGGIKMHYAKVLVLVVFLLSVSSVARAMDIYEWRTIAKGGCNTAIVVLGDVIRQAMQGERPIDGVLERVKAHKNIIPAVKENFVIYDRNMSAEFLLDDAGAQIVVKTVVKQFFADDRLVSRFLNIPAQLKATEVCTKEVLRYDPDGIKATAYSKINKANREANSAKKQAEDEEKSAAYNKKAAAEKAISDADLAKWRAEHEANEAKVQADNDRQKAEMDKKEVDGRQADIKMLDDIKAKDSANRAEVLKRQQEDNERSAKSSADYEAAIAKQETDRKKAEEDRIKENSGLKGFFKGIL